MGEVFFGWLWRGGKGGGGGAAGVCVEGSVGDVDVKMCM